MGSESIACKPCSIAELASTAATDVGMHGLLASQSCYHSVLPPSLCTLWTSSRFFITKQTSLHPFDFVRNLFHLLVLVLLSIMLHYCRVFKLEYCSVDREAFAVI